MLLTEKIDTDDFREMNAECKAQFKKLKAQLAATELDHSDFRSLLDTGIKTFLDWGQYMRMESWKRRGR